MIAPTAERLRRRRALRLGRALFDWAVALVVAIALVIVLEAKVAKPYRVPSPSMEPTLHCARPHPFCRGSSDEHVIANRLAYRFGDPKRGQVVVFAAPPRASVCGDDGAGVTFVKRLVGLPGETVTERNGFVSIDGKPLRDSYVEPALRDHGSGTWHVPRGAYFFLGDDRAHSCDSRAWGSVPRSSLIGPVLFSF